MKRVDPMKSNAQVWAMIALLASFWWPSFVSAQGESGAGESLSEGWETLSADDLVRQIKPLMKNGKLPGEFDNSVRERAASLLKEFDVRGAGIEQLPTLDTLHELGHKRLDPEIRKRINSELLMRPDDWANRPYEEIRAKVMMLVRSKQQLAAYAEARKWVQAGGTLEAAKRSPQAIEDLKHPLAGIGVDVLFKGGDPVMGGASIKWEGSLIAPVTGDYIISVCPANINADYPGYRSRLETRVWLNDQEVVTATRDQWSPTSGSVRLTAGQPTSLRMETEFALSPTQYPHGVLNALLYWEGPGIAKTIVPASALVHGIAGDAGLEATYRWRSVSGESQSVTQIDPVIDFVWPFGGLGRIGSRVGESPELLLLAKSRWRETVSPARLDTMEQAGQVHPLVSVATEVAASLSSAQRGELLDVLLARPSLIEGADARTIWKFYRSFHMSSPEKALDVFGAWAAKHADDACDVLPIASTYGALSDLRDACRELSTCVFHELPTLIPILQSRHLERPDGICVLPVGYTLNYGYHTTGRLAEWRKVLDDTLSNASLTGDRRVNWLLLRAHAEEIHAGPTRPYYALSEQVTLGRAWLDEALEVAQSPDAKARVSLELAARLVHVGRPVEAKSVLDAAPAPASEEGVARLQRSRMVVDQAIASQSSSATP
jgi:hypothetical protein